MRLGMNISCKIKRVFYDFWSFVSFWGFQVSLVGAVAFLIIVAPLTSAVAQFPGVGSEAPRGVATTGNDYASSDANYEDASVSDAGDSDIVSNDSNGARDRSSQSNYGGGSAGYLSAEGGISTLNLKKKYHREKLFIKKLRLEFAKIELIERKTGLPFSRDDVPRYLDELRGDLERMVAGAESGKITGGALTSIARDAYFIDARLNDHLDQLLEQAGQPIPEKPFFTITPAFPKEGLISDAGLDALSLKFELANYCEKALQAMGAPRNK